MRRYLSSGFKSPYWAALAYLGIAAGQSIAPDEMRAHTVPYAPPPPITLRTQVHLVEVPVVVRGAKRRTVAGLTRDDFEIFDNGKKQTITAFAVENFAGPDATPAGAKITAPTGGEPKSEPRLRFITLCFDDLHTDAVNLIGAKDAAQQFVKTSLKPGDRVAVVTTSHTQDSEFIADAIALTAQIAKVTSRRRADRWLCPSMLPWEAYQIVNRTDPQLLQQKMAECSACQHDPCREDQVVLLAEEVWDLALLDTKNTLGVVENLVDGMAKLPGQRVILLTSAELFVGNRETDLDRLITKALRAEVILNTLDVKRLQVMFNPRRQGKEQLLQNAGMAALAAGAGGSFFHNSNDLLQGFRDLGMAPETMYLLGFAPSSLTANGRYHNLKVRLTAGRDVTLQARLGYTAPSAKDAAPDTVSSKLDREVMASDTVSDLPAWFTWAPGPSNVNVVAHFDVSHLHFEVKQSRRAQKLTIVAVLLDSGGNVVTGKRSDFDLNLMEATFAQLAKTSFTASMTLKAPPGSYAIRAVVQDGLDGKVTAACGSVRVE